MTRITGFNPPANISALLGDSLKTNKASAYASASAYPSSHKLKAKGKSMHWAHPLNFSEAARWMIEHGPAAWRALPKAERQRHHAEATAEGRTGWNRWISAWLS